MLISYTYDDLIYQWFTQQIVSGSVYIAYNGKGGINWNECGRKWSLSHFRHYPGICLQQLRKTKTNLSRRAGLQAEVQTWNLFNT